MPAVLIEICGPDGAGKSTLVDGLRARIRGHGGVAYSRTLRSESRNLLDIVRREMPGAQFAAREFEIAVLLDAVAQGGGELAKYRGNKLTHVFAEQYRGSLLARLFRAGLADRPELRALLGHVPPPDLSLRLAASPETCLGRIRERPKGDGMLAEVAPAEAMRRLTESFADAADCLGYPQQTLDAEEPAGDLLEAAWARVAPALGLRG